MSDHSPRRRDQRRDRGAQGGSILNGIGKVAGWQCRVIATTGYWTPWADIRKERYDELARGFSTTLQLREIYAGPTKTPMDVAAEARALAQRAASGGGGDDE